MSKYNPLREYLQKDGKAQVELSFSEIHDILGIEIDHSFLTYQKELLQYGYKVEKISLKEKTVAFTKLDETHPSGFQKDRTSQNKWLFWISISR